MLDQDQDGLMDHMYNGLLAIVLLFVCSMTARVVAQGPLMDCRKIVGVKDEVRRNFDDRSTISFDVDGDGRPDKMTSRVKSVKIPRKNNSKLRDAATENHWIIFDMNLSTGRVINSFFKYKYGSRIGNEDVDYWVYAIIPCRMNREKRISLFFYSGDDTSEEKIVLANRGNNFKIYSRKTNGLGE